MTKNNKNPICIILCGLPGSGKSTWREEFLKENPDFAVHSQDDIIEEKAKDLNSTYDSIFENYVSKANQLFRDNLKDSIKNRENIIVDRTNLSKKSRRSILSQLPKCYNVYIEVFIVSEKSQSLYRENLLKRTSKQIPDKVVEDMKLRFEFPLLTENDSIIEINQHIY